MKGLDVFGLFRKKEKNTRYFVQRGFVFSPISNRLGFYPLIGGGEVSGYAK